MEVVKSATDLTEGHFAIVSDSLYTHKRELWQQDFG
jgi:hypothetical protein